MHQRSSAFAEVKFYADCFCLFGRLLLSSKISGIAKMNIAAMMRKASSYDIITDWPCTMESIIFNACARATSKLEPFAMKPA